MRNLPNKRRHWRYRHLIYFWPRRYRARGNGRVAERVARIEVNGSRFELFIRGTPT